jgi:hypothetical protein
MSMGGCTFELLFNAERFLLLWPLSVSTLLLNTS